MTDVGSVQFITFGGLSPTAPRGHLYSVPLPGGHSTAWQFASSKTAGECISLQSAKME